MISIGMEVRRLSMLLFVPCQQGRFLAYMGGVFWGNRALLSFDGEQGTRALTPLLRAPQSHRTIPTGLVPIRFMFYRQPQEV